MVFDGTLSPRLKGQNSGLAFNVGLIPTPSQTTASVSVESACIARPTGCLVGSVRLGMQCNL